MTIRAVVIWSLLGLAVGGSTAYGQSLAEVARNEEARRKAVKTPARVYTIRDVRRLVGGGPLMPPARVAAEAASPTAQAPPPEPAGTPPQPPPAAAEIKDEAHWRQVLGDARTKLERTTLVQSTLKSQYEALALRFTSLGDATQRALVIAEMEKVQGEIDRLQQEINQQTQDIANLEDQARRAGVPPGWIRQPGI